MARTARSRIAWQIAWQVAVTIAFFLAAIWLVDLARLWDSLQQARWRWIPPALLAFTGAKYIDSWRWRYLLRGLDAPPQPALFAAFLIGNMVNNVLPLRAGDVAKIQVLANRFGTPRAGLAASVFVVEATLDGIIFAGFLVGAIALADLEELPGFSLRALAIFSALAAVAFALALALSRGRLGVPLPARWAGRIRGIAHDARAGLHALGTVRRTLAAIALSVPAWLAEAGMFALMGRAFGLDLPYATFVAVMVAANVAVALPIAIWNLGPYEAAVTAVLALAGVESGVALSYALAVHLLVNLWIDATGLVAFWIMGVRPGEVLRVHAEERSQ